MRKKIKGAAFIILSFIIAFSCINASNVSADMPANDDSTIGEVYDGIDFDALIGNSIYYGTYDHAVSGTTGWGFTAKVYDGYETPILWRVAGEDSVDGVPDEALTNVSEYILGSAGFSTQNMESSVNWPGSGMAPGDGAYSFTFGAGGRNTSGMLRSLLENQFDVAFSTSGNTYKAEKLAVVPTNLQTQMIDYRNGNVISDGATLGTSYDDWGGGYTWYNSSQNLRNWPQVLNGVTVYIPTGVWDAYGNGGVLYYGADGLQTSDNAFASDNSSDIEGQLKYGNNGISTTYWLRSPMAVQSYMPHIVRTSSGNAQIETNVFGNDSGGIRPIFKLDPKKVIMTHEVVDNITLSSEILNDKESESKWNYTTSNERSNYKLTILSDNVSLNELEDSKGNPIYTNGELSTSEGEDFTVHSNNYVGDYLAYKIVQTDSNGNRIVVGYGTNKGSSDLSILTISSVANNVDSGTDLVEGDYTLYVWSQAEDSMGQAGESIHSFEGSDLMTFDLTITEKSSTYTVTYHGNTNTGGTAPTDSSSPYNAGSTVTVLDEGDLVKTNHKFMGWSTTTTGNVDYVESDDFVINANIDLYAVWEPIPTYTVIYDGNTNTGGTAPVDNKNPYNEKTSVTVLDENDLVKENHKFIGWSTTATGSVKYVAGSTFNITGNVILYAIWEPLPAPTYTVTFESNGGSAVDSQTGMNIGDYVIEPTNPTRDGYKFIGWYLDDGTFLNAWDFDNDAISGDMTLYAKWEKEKDSTTPPITPDPNEPDTQNPTDPEPQEPNDSTSQGKPSTKPTETTDGKDINDVVETGDATNMMLYISLLLLSSVYFIGRKKVSGKK